MIQLKNERLSEIATLYDRINTILYQFIKPFLDKKMSIFEEYGAFNAWAMPYKKELKSYHIYPKYLDIQAWADTTITMLWIFIRSTLRWLGKKVIF